MQPFLVPRRRPGHANIAADVALVPPSPALADGRQHDDLFLVDLALTGEALVRRLWSSIDSGVVSRISRRPPTARARSGHT